MLPPCLLGVVLLAVVGGAGPAGAVLCNYCYNADLPADCHLNVMQCPHEYVCSVETTVVSYQGSHHEQKQYTMYKMGCEHYSMCRDNLSSGRGPYGYARVRRVCCCTDVCETADGTGRKDFTHCPMLWTNSTLGDVSSRGGATAAHLGVVTAMAVGALVAASVQEL